MFHDVGYINNNGTAAVGASQSEVSLLCGHTATRNDAFFRCKQIIISLHMKNMKHLFLSVSQTFSLEMCS